jgi:iduronate 2-sulfatase
VQGRSLLPVLQGATTEVRDSAITEARGWKALRTARYRYVCEATGAEHLWDIERDPGEYADVATDPEHAATLAEARHHLLTRVIDNERSLARIWPY